MAETWSGIVVRATTSENGTVPRSASSGSPDIIISGTSTLKDPSILTKEENYGKSYDNKLYIGVPNYLYVRGKNFTAGDLSGTWTLYYATPNVLLYPYLWIPNQLGTSTSNKNPPFTIKAGAIGASEDCFKWVPPNVSDHYCMIAVAETPGHPNPLKDVRNITDLAEILSTNGNIAQRNVQMVRGDIPQVVSTARYDQGDEGAEVDLAVIFKNIPKGSKYIIGSGTPLNGHTLSHSADNTQDNDFKYAWVGEDIPAQWWTVFNFTLTFGTDWTGIPPDAKPSVTIRGELVQGSDDRLFHLGHEPDPDQLGNRRMHRLGGPVRVVVAGSVQTLYTDVPRK